MSPAEGTVVLVGLGGADRDLFLAAIRSAAPGAPVEEVLGPAEAVAMLAGTDVQCVVVGPAATGDRWDTVGLDLRRVAPLAALVALTDAPAPGAAWDDVVGPHEREPAVLARVMRSAFAVAAANRRLVRWAMRDPLTDVLNRRGLEAALVREAGERERGHGPVVALLVDCDDFKAINDRFGLATGDDVLRRLAGVLTRSVRARDTVARVGGDEFVVLLPGTRTWEAVQIAERIRTAVRTAVRLPDGDALSVSIGVRRLSERVVRVRELVEATQDGLRQSKAAGKDQVRVVGERGGPSAAISQLPAEFSDDDGSLPEGTRLFAFRHREVRAGVRGPVVLRTVRPDVDDDAALVIFALRASRPAWDLQWFQRALEAAGDGGDLPVHVRVFPGTLRHVGPQGIRAAIPPGIPPARVTLAIDDQYLTGDPGPLRAPLAELRGEGMGLCIDAADLGRPCLEALVLLRPDRVRLDPALTEGVAGSRIRRAAVGRYARLCAALDIAVIGVSGGGTDPAEDAEALAALGVTLFEA